MKGVKARITKAFGRGARIPVSDNSGAKVAYFISAMGGKTVKGRYPYARVGDMITVSVIKGDQSVRKQVFKAIVIRQKKGYRRQDGTRIKFEDNAVVICKDDKGNPKGTLIKGPIAKEAAEKWTPISKISTLIV